VVWEPILKTDWMRPGSGVLARICDPRAVQFWDRQHLIAQELRRERAANPGEPLPACCEDHEFYWDLVAVYPPEVRWEATLPPAKFMNGPVVPYAGDLTKNLEALRSPRSR
jgi:hypothetical protein